MGIIRIEKLKVKTIIGCKEWERKKRQKLYLNLRLTYPSGPAAASDNLDDALNYHVLAREIIARVEKTDFFLLEKLTDFVLDIVMESPLVRSCTVRIDKPAALSRAENVSFENCRRREKG